MAGNGWSNQVVSVIILEVGSPFSGIFFYDPVIGPGDLILSIAPNAGTDPYGNSYPQGISFGYSGDSQVVIGTTGGSPLIYFPTGNTHIANSSGLQTVTQGGTGNGQYDQFQILGAQNNVQLDSVISTWVSSSTDGTIQAHHADIYGDPSLIGHTYYTVSYDGANILAGSVTAVEPGTGTSRANPAVAETWHTATLDTGFTTSASDQAPRYRLEGTSGGVVRLDGTVYTSGAVAAGATMFTLPAGYRPAADRRRFVGVTSASGYTLGATLVNVATTGLVTIGPAAGAAGQQICLDGMTFPID